MKFLLLVSLVAFSSVAMAAKPYGMAGCGLGNIFFGKDSQVIAATTNGSSGSQTFGISSGTSNCVTASEQTAMIKNFIEANYESLVTDMAKGQGDSVKTLSSFYGCNSDSFASELKTRYEVVTPKKENATQFMVNINNAIEDSKALSANCTNAI
jgi:hypothetical protein